MTKSQRYVSSELTHFVGAGLEEPESRYGLLMQILRSGMLLSPGQSGLVIQVGKMGPITTAKRTYKINFREPLSSNKKYQASIVCFADIPLEDLQLHIAKYGPFGLSFLRPFLLRQGANPVFYVSRRSIVPIPRPRSLEATPTSLAALYDSAESHLSELVIRPSLELSAKAPEPPEALARDFLTNHLFPFMKFFDAELPDEHPDNYYMEREWRVVGHVQFAISDIERILLPRAFGDRFRRDVPAFQGQVSFTG